VSGYEFVSKKYSNIDRYGIRFTNENGETLFFGKVVNANGQRYLGKYHPQHGTCYIAVGDQEFPETSNLEILQSKSDY